MVTHAFAPLKESALPNRPEVVHAALLKVPLLPAPEVSAVVVLVLGAQLARVGAHRGDTTLVEALVLLHEARHSLGREPEQVVTDEHLTIAVWACADADGRDRELLRDSLGEGCRNAFEHERVRERQERHPARRLEPAVQRVLITPALHRAHHVADWRELDTNFGTIVSAWDRLFGTFRSSAADRRISTGLPDWTGPRAPALSDSLLLPFRRPTARAR